MNIFKTKNKNVPENLPFEKGSGDFEIKISKNKIKKIAKIIIITLIVILSTPRIISNITSTTEVILIETEKFPVIFPALTATSENVISFVSSEIKKLPIFFYDNLALMAELLYSRKIDEKEIIGSYEENISEKPVRIIVEKVGINSFISNPVYTDLETLDEALNYGVVRYPKSGLLGENDNVFLFGHSTSIALVRNEAYKSLNGLKDLQTGDEIKIQSENREFLYKVNNVKMEKDSDIVVKFNTRKKTLTISTCNTLGNKEDRYVLQADFITSYKIKKEIISNITPEENPQPTTTKNQTTEHQYNIIPTQNTQQSIVSNPNGKVDLTAQITEIGILDSSNQFIATSTLKSSDKIAFKFIISNIGTKKAEDWSFNVVLPTYPQHMYHSNSQENLGPGEKIEYALGFDKPQINNEALIIVNVDPTRSIWETSEDNNIIKKFIKIIE